MARKPNRKDTAKNRGRALTQLQRESIVQAYALSGNKSAVTRDLHFSYPTVCKVLREAETDRSLQAARKSALEDVAGRMHDTTVQIIDSIGPLDLESGREFKRDKDGNVTGVVQWGPSLMQKVTSAAILTDKMRVIVDTQKALDEDHARDPSAMPLPGDVQSALRAISERVQRLRIIDVQLADKNPELVSRVQDVAHRASLNDQIEEADYEELKFDDFDNPGA